MKNCFFLLIFPIFGWSQVQKDTIKVYFLGGQSNMQGYGFNKDLPLDLNRKFKNAYIFQGNSLVDNSSGAGLGVWEQLQPGHGTGFSSDGKVNKHSDRFGVELSFAATMSGNNDNKQKIALIKYSRNGSSIDLFGAPQFGTWESDRGLKPIQNQYDFFLKTVKNALSCKDINSDGIEDVLVPAGILWMQGESDANSEEVASKYYNNLSKLMTLLRATFLDNNLPIVIGKISDSGNDPDGKVWDYGELVQFAQEKFAKTHYNVKIIRSTAAYKYSDQYHYDSAGYVDLGKQFAKAMISIKN